MSILERPGRAVVLVDDGCANAADAGLHTERPEALLSTSAEGSASTR
ncbi:hypothetical protein LWC33_33080 [Pseudonocardia sp. RS11V-5]|nr:hypothetical protein [Pseudonocardia terrae]MCE3556263.1 hypothetical protein [Pseudonocardia terrae]